MNELSTQTMQLPSNIEEVVDYVVINEEKLNIVKAAIRAAKKAGSINLEELERQQRELEVTTVLAQCRLGELTREMEKAKNQHSASPSLGLAKREQLESLGVSKQRASEYERMSAHPEIVEQVINSGGHVTKSAILGKIKETKEENKKQTFVYDHDDTCFATVDECSKYAVNTSAEPDSPDWINDVAQSNTGPVSEHTASNTEANEPAWLDTESTRDSGTEPEPVRRPHVVNNSTDNEWYTPSQYIEAAREVMGSIDLDPASNDFANETVKASKYYTEETDGLKQKWFGNVWLNPPYQTALIQAFADKLNVSNFNQAIVLVNNATETQWFRNLVKKASAIMFPSGRIRYVKRDGEHGTPLQGQAFIYYGENTQRFAEVFGKYGWVVMPYHKV